MKGDEELKEFLTRNRIAGGSFSTICKDQGNSSHLLKLWNDQLLPSSSKSIQKRRIQWMKRSLQANQSILNRLDPERMYFGGKIIDTVSLSSVRALKMLNNGISLTQLVKRPEFTDYKALFHAMPQLLHALEILHDNQLIHGDIKSDNITWDGSRLRLIDFDYLHTFHDSMQAYRWNCQTPNKLFIMTLSSGDINTFYMAWPFERFFNFQTCQFMFKKSPSSDQNIDIICNLIGASCKTDKALLKEFLYEGNITHAPQNIWIRLFIFFYHQHMSKKTCQLYQPDKFDIYSLGLVFWYLVLHSLHHKFHPGAETISLISTMISCNPKKRPSPRTAHDQWIKIWKPLSKKRERLQQQQDHCTTTYMTKPRRIFYHSIQPLK